MNDDLSHIVTQETKTAMSTYQGMGKIHTVMIGLTSGEFRRMISEKQPIYLIDSQDSYTYGQLRQLIYN